MDHLFLDKEGRWFHDGVEITHERTRALFAKNLHQEEDGSYCIRIGSEWATVQVEDTPYTIKSVIIKTDSQGRPSNYLLILSDETEELLDPRTLFVGNNHVLYCSVKNGRMRARFLRPAYYHLCEHLAYDEKRDRYWIPWEQGNAALEPNSACQGEE